MDYIWHALKHKANILFLISSVVLSFFFSFVYFWPAVAGVEILFVAFLSANPRFQKHVRSQLHSEEIAYELQRKRSFIRGSRTVYRNKLREFENLMKQIKLQYRQNKNASSGFIENSLSNLDALSESFIQTLYSFIKLQEITEKNSSIESIEDEIKKVKNEIETGSEKAREYLEKRLDILIKRKEKHSSVRENLNLMSTQLKTFEDTSRYLLDDSMTSFDHNKISERIETTLIHMNTAKETMDEIDNIMKLHDPMRL